MRRLSPGTTSLMNAPAADSLDARYFSLPGALLGETISIRRWESSRISCDRSLKDG